jgi:hypothetical protein
MALELRPAGRLVLVAAGLLLAWFGFDRAGWTPASWPHPFPPPVETERAEEPEAAPAEGREGAAPAAFAYGDAPACEARVRVAVPRYRWGGAPTEAAAGPAVAQVASARDALARLAAGEAEAALVSVSELVAAWDVAATRAAPRIAGLAEGAEPALATSLRIAGPADFETARIAAVPGSAEEFLVLAFLAREGIERYWLVAAKDADDAVFKLERGEVDAAAAPLPALAPVVEAGRARLVGGPKPLDPMVWVTPGVGCRPELPAGTAALLDLPAAWSAAVAIRPNHAPDDVLGVLDRRLLRALLAPAPGGGR